MRLRWVELLNFRNHADTRVAVPEGLVVAVGPNGSGKTNLMEAMFFLCSLTSPRVSDTKPLVHEGTAAGYVRGEVESLQGKALIEIEIPAAGANRVQVNRSPVRRKRDVRRQARAVFFGPDDLDVVRGDPGQRRRFLDEAVVALWPLKESLITGYDRTVRQRNRLLKDWEGRAAPTGLEAWDAELVEKGCALTRARAEAVTRMAPHAEEEFLHLTGYGLTCRHAASVEGDPLEEAFRARLAARREDELIRRTTLVGPHRDDVGLTVRDMGARAFASHGEAWAAALCLRIGLATAVAEELGEAPIVLLDDPFSALDPVRQIQAAERLAGRGQVVVSVADESHVPKNADEVWEVAAGSVVIRGAS